MAARVPQTMQAHILAFLEQPPPEEGPTRRPKQQRWGPRSHVDSDGPLALALRPLSTSAALELSTKGWVVVDSVLGASAARSAREDAEALAPRLRPAGVGQGLARMVDPSARADTTCFLEDETDPSLGDGLVAATRMLRSTRAQLARGGDLAAYALTPRVSTQLALYDGGGASYREHADENHRDEDGAERRLLTAVYYLNEHWKGGALRIGAVDVEPAADRLVVFESSALHQVLPTFSRRWALTQWWYARTPRRLERRVFEQPSAKPTIFVSIASYRDPLTEQTVRSALENATEPRRVRVGVVLQYDTLAGADDAWLGDWTADVVRVDHRDAAGPCPARALALETLRRPTDDFVLQVDAHTLFRPGWDEILLDQWRRCRNPSAILTAYPADFAAEGDERPVVLAPRDFNDQGILRITGRVLHQPSSLDPIPSPLWCAGFSFAPARAFDAAPYDPHLKFLFIGEELDMAARLWTHGFDFFAPATALVYHKWSRRGRPDFAADADAADPSRRLRLRARSIRRLKTKLRLVSDAADVGPCLQDFDIGTERSLAEFQARIGVDFAAKVIHPGSRDAGLPPHVFAATPADDPKIHVLQGLLDATLGP